MNTASSESTRASLLTPQGRGAVAVIVVEGPEAAAAVDCRFHSANRRHLVDQHPNRIVYGRWGSASGEDVIVRCRDIESVEIHSHGGAHSSQQILHDLAHAGCEVIGWQQRLAERSGCPFRAAAEAGLADAPTFRTASILLDQFQGALRRELEAIGTLVQQSNGSAAIERVEQLLTYAPLGLHLTQPWQVAIAGLPNVGKSSLLNGLLGYRRAIVLDQPGTTRDLLTATTAADGWPIQLYDTAGLHATRDEIEQAGMKLATGKLSQADLVLWVLDASQIPGDKELKCVMQVEQQIVQQEIQLDLAQTLAVVNKMDLAQSPLEINDQSIHTCAITGEGIEPLLDAVVKRLVPDAPPQGAAVPFTADQINRLRSVQRSCRQSDWPTAEATLRQSLLSQSRYH